MYRLYTNVKQFFPRDESKLLARQRYEDGPLVVKLYNNPHLRALRSKHQRSSTVPLPAVLSKLPPSIATFSTPTTNDALIIGAGEGLTVFVLVLPDGSGYCKYPQTLLSYLSFIHDKRPDA